MDWDHGIFFSGADAVHVATAIKFQCTEVLTTDDRMLKRADKLQQAGFSVKIIKPSATTCLPPNDKQRHLFDNLKAIKARDKANGLRPLPPAPSATVAIARMDHRISDKATEQSREVKDENDATEGNGKESSEEEPIKNKPTSDGAVGVPELRAPDQAASLSAESGDSGAEANPPIQA